MKSEIRNPKAERSPKLETRNMSLEFGLRASGFFRPSGFGFRILFLAYAPLLLADTNSDLADNIPPLRPPRGEIPPSWWEQHGGWVIAGGCFALVALAALIWWLTRPKPPV